MAVRAPALPVDVEWLNVARPLTTEELRGRILLLDFWTSACINCQHTLSTLAALERELAGEPLVILGIHSPKFDAQREAGVVREAVEQLAVTHPVLLDADAAITHSYAVTGWPTLIVVDPRGYLVATLRGEPEPAALLRALRMMLDQTRADGSLTGAALPPPPAPAEDHHQFRFPGAVATGPDGFFAADQGHGQVVALDPAGDERSRLPAPFRRPCGLALDPARRVLYVADTPEHTVRAVDLATGDGTAVAQARSPWGLAWDGARLYIAEAGRHRVLVHDPAAGTTTVLAGTGVEGCRDGAAGQAWFAQPSGLALMGDTLYVADAETSSIRAIEHLATDPTVRTVCGSGELFGFGHRDGTGRAALLQHPIGITAGPGLLLVADTYNNAVRTVDPATGACGTLPLDEDLATPEGLAWGHGRLLVADTGHHRLVPVTLL